VAIVNTRIGFDKQHHWLRVKTLLAASFGRMGNFPFETVISFISESVDEINKIKEVLFFSAEDPKMARRSVGYYNYVYGCDLQ
jgi:hypothetical protein